MQPSLEPADAIYYVPVMSSLITNCKRTYARVRESKLSGRQINALMRGSLDGKLSTANLIKNLLP